MAELKTLRAKQAETVALATGKPCWGLFHDPGTGKTGTTITLIRNLMNEKKRYLKVLIFVPPVGVKQWKRQFGEFSYIPKDRIFLLQKSGKQRKELFDKVCFTETLGEKIPQGQVVVTNYESLFMQGLYQSFIDWQPDILVIDESHYVKNHQAMRSNMMDFLANPQRRQTVFYKGAKKHKVVYASRVAPSPAPIKYLLTGTPFGNSPEDLFMQFLIMDDGKTFGQNFYTFRARYFIDKNAGMPKERYFPNWVLAPWAKEEFNRLIYLSANRVTLDECADLPERVMVTVPVEMSPEQKRLYDEMKRDLIAVLNDKACVATLAITKALRLQQIASGYIKLVDGEEVSLGGNPKLDALEGLFEKLLPTGKIIVWCSWRNNYTQIEELCTRLGIKCSHIIGGMTAKQRDENIEEFTKGKAQVMIANAKAAGVSVDLIEARYSIGFSRTGSLIELTQSMARNRRIGSEMHKTIVHYDLVTEGSIEELTLESLEDKKELSLSILRQNISRL